MGVWPIQIFCKKDINLAIYNVNLILMLEGKIKIMETPGRPPTTTREQNRLEVCTEIIFVILSCHESWVKRKVSWDDHLRRLKSYNKSKVDKYDHNIWDYSGLLPTELTSYIWSYSSQSLHDLKALRLPPTLICFVYEPGLKPIMTIVFVAIHLE